MNILLVEDHPTTRSVLERMLSGWGHHVAAASDLRTGIGFLKSDRFDAIVSDIALPDGTGYALMDNARRNGIKAVAVAISAFPYPPDVHEPMVTGFDHHLSKPFTPEQLRSALGQTESAGEPLTAQ
jgi:CheY-like chemotaxis protein